MKYRALIFDLDGTLTDSGPGIRKAAAFALSHLNLPVPEEKKLNAFVGPPLREEFPLFGVQEEQVDEAIRLFRLYYLDKGVFDNTVYPGTEEFLQKMKESGRKLYLATTKPEKIAHLVLDHFDLMKYFTFAAGATPDHTREKKADIIEYLRTLADVGDDALMVGDTILDVRGSAAHGIPCAGVSWGYGNTVEMKNAGAVMIADDWDKLAEFIEG